MAIDRASCGAPVMPMRLLAGGGPSVPDERVLQAMTTPLIGQFDPAFTAIMDEVMDLARQVLLTDNVRCFPVSALTAGGLEAVLNSVLEPGDRVCVVGSDAYRAEIEDMAVRYGAVVGDTDPKLTVLPHVDPETGERRQPTGYAGFVLLDATHTAAGSELRANAWDIDIVVAGVDVCLGAPPGLTLVTYNEPVEHALRERRTPPMTSYLDLTQLQAYWSPERLNHHTAPTSLVYGLREALRLVLEEGLEARWQRHAQVGAALRAGLTVLGLSPSGAGPLLIAQPPHDGEALRRQLRAEYGVLVGTTAVGAWRIGLCGTGARMDACLRLLAALEQVLIAHARPLTPGAARAAALEAIG